MQEGMFLQKSAVAKGTVLKERRGERERERGRKEAHPNLNPGPLEVRAANRALITVINEMLAANGDGVGRNARR